MALLKKSDWQPWIWPLFTYHWVGRVFGVFFYKCGKWFAHLCNPRGDELQWRTAMF